jgi:hypothetical protein
MLMTAVELRGLFKAGDKCVWIVSRARGDCARMKAVLARKTETRAIERRPNRGTRVSTLTPQPFVLVRPGP